MKTNIYVKFFLIIIFIFFGYYVYNLANNFTNSNYDIKSKDNILFYDNLVNGYTDINSIISHKFSMLRTSDDKKMQLYQCSNTKSFIELGDVYTGLEGYEISNIISFATYVKNLGIDFIYMEPPLKAYFYRDILNKYNYNVYDNNYKHMLSEFKHNNINYLDTYLVLSTSKINQADLYYNSDHHPRIETSYYITKKLVQKLNRNFNYKLDIKLLANDKFHKKNLSNSQNGYYTRALHLNSKFYDNFTYLLPNYDTSYKVCNNGCVVGDMESVIYENMQLIDNDHYLRIPGGTEAIVKYINNNAPNDKKIVMVANSFVKGIIPFLSLTVKEIDVIDVRVDVGKFNDNLKKYIDDSNPDLVIYYTKLFGDEEYNRLL